MDTSSSLAQPSSHAVPGAVFGGQQQHQQPLSLLPADRQYLLDHVLLRTVTTRANSRGASRKASSNIRFVSLYSLRAVHLESRRRGGSGSSGSNFGATSTSSENEGGEGIGGASGGDNDDDDVDDDDDDDDDDDADDHNDDGGGGCGGGGGGAAAAAGEVSAGDTLSLMGGATEPVELLLGASVHWVVRRLR